jgi:hypothetical protein
MKRKIKLICSSTTVEQQKKHRMVDYSTCLVQSDFNGALKRFNIFNIINKKDMIREYKSQSMDQISVECSRLYYRIACCLLFQQDIQVNNITSPYKDIQDAIDDGIQKCERLQIKNCTDVLYCAIYCLVHFKTFQEALSWISTKHIKNMNITKQTVEEEQKLSRLYVDTDGDIVMT